MSITDCFSYAFIKPFWLFCSIWCYFSLRNAAALSFHKWKASTRTEGDSKAPSTSTATSTCRKAGARGKHTGNVITTPGSVRGEEKRLEQAPGNRPEERMGPQDTASLARHCQSGGRATPKLKEETTRWEEPFQLPVH